MTAERFVFWTFVACFTYICAVYATFAVLLVVSAREGVRLARQTRNDDLDVLSDSRFTIPVSLVAPLYNEGPIAVAAVESMLRQDYPEYEVIVVNDGSRDDTLERLHRAFDLERREVFYRAHIGTSPVRGIFRSRRDARLTVVDKPNGGKADALNVGLNLSRYRYLCTVDGDTVLYPDALVRGMRVAMHDPGTVLGVTSQVEITSRPEEGADRPRGAHVADRSMLMDFQRLDYLRAFMNNRLGWSRLDFMLCSVGAFAIWRRDVLVESQGFSNAFTCEDIEVTFRVHERYLREGRPYRIVSLGDTVGRTEGPDSVRNLVSQRARWQRVITETVWAYRRMMLNPRYKAVGLLGMPYYVLVEVLAPVFQTLAVVALPVMWWHTGFQPTLTLAFLVAVACTNGVLTNLALLLQDRSARLYRIESLVKLIALGPLDLFLYRPLLFWAQTKGLIDFLRGQKGWNKFERNRRDHRAA